MPEWMLSSLTYNAWMELPIYKHISIPPKYNEKYENLRYLLVIFQFILQ